MALPRQLLLIAERQYAVFSLAQARDAGVTQDMLDNRRASGELRSPHRGVYIIAGSPPSWEQSLMAACLAGGPGTVVSHVAGLQHWELIDLADPPVEVTVDRNRSPRFGRGLVVVHRPLDLTRRQVTLHRGLWVTNPLRTMVDAAGVAPLSLAQEALDAGIAQRLFTIEAVDRMRRRLAKPGRTGSGKTAELLESQVISTHNRSVLEAEMARLWRRFGLPAYEFQHVIRTPDGRFVGRVDFAIVKPKIVVEVDGWGHHSSPRDVDADNRREHKLIALGWIVLRFSWWRIKNEPAQVAAEILAAVSARLAA
jgi:very-short-patch-repair endonuclease